MRERRNGKIAHLHVHAGKAKRQKVGQMQIFPLTNKLCMHEYDDDVAT
jgi:hypothetical protein